MQAEFVSLMRKLAPDLTEEMGRRALILERIQAMQPVGRRQLAQRLNLSEREVRNTAAVLRDLGYIQLNASGMMVTPQADEVLHDAKEFSRVMSGLTDLENRLEALLNVNRVLIASGDADQDGHVLNEVGRLCAARLRGMLQNGNTLAITGGRSVAAVARNLQNASPLNVMVVPARGGLGRSVEWEANTIAEEIAGRIGGHYRLIHVPDNLDQAAMQELLKLPEISEAVELLQRADIILHGIGKARETMLSRRVSREIQARLTAGNAQGECLGAYYAADGRCLLEAKGLVVDLARLKPTCRMIAVAAGAGKAEAILSVMKNRRHELLVTDEGAASAMLRILRDSGCESADSGFS